MSKFTGYHSWSEAEMEAPIFSMDNLPLMHRQYQFKHFEGVLLTVIEELGLKETQENAVKKHIRDELWNFVRQGYVIPDDFDEKLGLCQMSPNQLIPKKKK